MDICVKLIMLKKNIITKIAIGIAMLSLGAFFSFFNSQKKVIHTNGLNVAPKTWKSTLFDTLNRLPEWQQRQIIQQSIVILKDHKKSLPFAAMDVPTAHISIGGSDTAFINMYYRFGKLEFQKHLQSLDELEQIEHQLKKHERLIVSIHADAKDTLNFTSESIELLNHILRKYPSTLIVFGPPINLKQIEHAKAESLIIAYENHPFAQEEAAQIIVGAVPAIGKLKYDIGDHFHKGDGVHFTSNGRLRYGSPEMVGLQSKDFEAIDSIVKNAIDKGAFPGCQIAVCVDTQFIFQKSYGYHTYENKSKVKNSDLYDIASVTKIAASTLLSMHLHSENKFSLDKTLGNYLPKLTENTPFANVVIKDMMAHQAGFTPWIAFYKKLLVDGKLDATVFSETEKEGFSTKVAENIYISNSYNDSIYKQIVQSKLGEKKYEYSDLCFYFIQKINETIINEKQNTFLDKHFYSKMGLQRLGYLPLIKFSKEEIAPTENDKIFRNQLIHGYVHDQGAAMLGGVAGHAGLFSNAGDLAQVMQLFLNKGKYGGMQFFNAKTAETYTQQQFPGNRRGAGFDRPNASGVGTCDKSASQSSYGHSGFTGTLAWVDPETKFVFVFLSNRVNPDADNWKIRDMHVRTEIQHVVYEALAKRKAKK